MNIAILSRGPLLYSTQSLQRAAVQRGHHIRIIDHTRCHLLIQKGKPEIFYENMRLTNIDAIIPRVGASVTAHGATVIEHFEMMGVFSILRSQALQQARDKLRSLQKLFRCSLPVPRTALVGPSENLLPLINAIGGLPIVIKLLESTHGEGVVLAETYPQAVSIIEAFQRVKERVLIQEFIAEARGADVRALVVGQDVVAVMKRQAEEGEFRSNLHRGANGTRDTLSQEETEIVKKTVKLMGLEVAGVDLLRSKRGPLIMEVNASPGLEGIETITGINVANKIVEHLEESYHLWREAQSPGKKISRK